EVSHGDASATFHGAVRDVDRDAGAALDAPGLAGRHVGFGDVAHIAEAPAALLLGQSVVEHGVARLGAGHGAGVAIEQELPGDAGAVGEAGRDGHGPRLVEPGRAL